MVDITAVGVFNVRPKERRPSGQKDMFQSRLDQIIDPTHALVKLGVDLRQTYERVGKLALIKHQRYAHAKQFKRANKALRTLRTQLGRVIRDIRRKIGQDEVLNAAFATPLSLANRVREQRQRQRGQKVYSLHAPEVECIGKGKAHKPDEFGVKVSVATPIQRSKGGQFVAHVKALPGAPYDGHTMNRPGFAGGLVI